ncbi:Coenzyme F420 hydrogenase/dehydrogenase, beta subunit C-terminal domain [Roseovarius aestuarii]|uniref:Coenzyme F420-reducing hydrogenase subunit beta n=1 Tax=Roseovarius aestuarii TaxID=475083 RepID=A0A1X7BYF7_9RHOB|nr:Coenzyme F420 hydrogenase/dehydrogenase, beta subunit C-terminal domain [Roseovarius aestuarii]SMC14736.1 coenzyme F420-reducing hydrogenase subunit beta [Roseovarius aestuarii]
MKRFETLDQIIDSGFCIGCGLCKALAPDAAIEMRMNTDGHLRPVPTRAIDQSEEQAILDLCPGINVTGPFSTDAAPGFDAVWGECRRVAKGYATDRDLRFAASSGGIMTAINIHLLNTRQVEFVLQAIPDPENPYGSIPAICRTKEDLMKANGSRYASAATLSTILDVLDLGEPFAVSLKPCDVAGIRNLQRRDARARDLVRFTQAMFCGTVPSVSALEGFYARRDMDFQKDRPTSFRWRGNGCPGPTIATMPDGRILEATYNELWDDNPWTTQFRCKLCPDAIGLQADIAVGDNWFEGVPKGEGEGWNALTAHTQIGLEVLNSCEAADEIKLIDSDIEHLNNVQPHHVKMREEMKSRLSACNDSGLAAPNFSELNLDRCSDRLSPDAQEKVRKGTAARIDQISRS